MRCGVFEYESQILECIMYGNKPRLSTLIGLLPYGTLVKYGLTMLEFLLYIEYVSLRFYNKLKYSINVAYVLQ